MPYYESADVEATRAFYTQVLGLEEDTFGGGYIGFGSGQAQVVFGRPGVERSCPTWAWTSIRVRPSTRRTLKRCGPGTR